MTRIRGKVKLTGMLVVSVIMLALSVFGCAGEGTPTKPGEVTPGVKTGGTLRLATNADAKSLDPALLSTQPDLYVTSQIYDKLIEKREDLTLKPELAVSWEPNQDLTSYTLQLRQGVKFHSGKEFTAEDVVFTFKRLLHPEVASSGRAELSSIKDVVAVDEHTVRFDLTVPDALFPHSLAIYQALILPANIDTSKLTTETDGTGPFILEEFVVGQRAVLRKNPNYWDEGKPYLDEVVFFYMPSAESRIEALKSGSVDVVYPLAPVDALGLAKVSGVKISEVASPSYLSLAMDVTKEPFTNKKVRQAFQAATDREAVRKVAMLGRGALGADIPIFPTDEHYSPEMKVPAYDVERARRLLQEAGYPDGIDITLHTSALWPGLLEMAVAFKESAAPAGIRVDLKQWPDEVFGTKVWLKEAFYTQAWNGRIPDAALSIIYLSDAPWNEAHYQNPVLDELIKKARGQADLESRKQTYLEIYNILDEDVPRIIPVFTPLLIGMRDNVSALEAHAGWFLLLEGTWLER